MALKQTSWPAMIKFLDKAMVKYQEAIRLEPTNAWYHLNLGWSYAQLSFMDSFNPHIISHSSMDKLAQREFTLALTLDPKNPHITNYLADWKKTGK